MRTYETIFIVNPQLVGDEYTAVLEKFKGVLVDQQAEILKVAEWGTKRLAYPVKKHEQGIYVLINFNAESGVVKEFERRMRIDESIIKFQTLILEGGLKAPAVQGVLTDEVVAEDDDDMDEATE